MAVSEILFKELPFRPDRNQVFYIEKDYDREANAFIRSHYGELKSRFHDFGMEFYYLPYLLKEHDIEAKVRYYAPYLSPKLLVREVLSNAFVPYISDTEVRTILKPSFLFEARPDGILGDVRFLTVPFDDLITNNAESFDQLMCLVLRARESFDIEEQGRLLSKSNIYESVKSSQCSSIICDLIKADVKENEIVEPCFSAEPLFDLSSMSDICLENETAAPKTQAELEEEQSLIETAAVLRELRKTVQKLRLEGVSLMAIHEFIDKQEPLSRMTITPDYRIFLPDYNNMEIEMGALPKAIYFLYLRYPQGIIYKHMPDYFGELLNIYKQLRPNTDEARLNLTITKVVNPLGNAMNENIARIRKAFVEKFDEHLANNYIITGERGAQYSISLDRDLITWEE